MKITKDAKFHFDIAALLLKSIEESIKYTENQPGAYCKEHSAESVKRRCIQIRQELLMAEKGVSSDYFG